MNTHVNSFVRLSQKKQLIKCKHYVEIAIRKFKKSCNVIVLSWNLQGNLDLGMYSNNTRIKIYFIFSQLLQVGFTKKNDFFPKFHLCKLNVEFKILNLDSINSTVH